MKKLPFTAPYGSVKLSNVNVPFRIVFEVKLDNGYELVDMTKTDGSVK